LVKNKFLHAQESSAQFSLQSLTEELLLSEKEIREKDWPSTFLHWTQNPASTRDAMDLYFLTGSVSLLSWRVSLTSSEKRTLQQKKKELEKTKEEVEEEIQKNNSTLDAISALLAASEARLNAFQNEYNHCSSMVQHGCRNQICGN